MNLICPLCKNSLIKNENSFCCVNNHHFDLAKSGYINLYLTNKSKSHGDNKEMIHARTSFLSKNYYLPLKKKLIEEIDKINPNTLVDLACGEGYYTRDFNCPNKIGIDLSKDAIQYASKQDKSSQYCVASIFDCPIATESVDCVTTLFAPIATNEINRILTPGGYFVGVFPAENHLLELKKTIYDTVYLNEKPQIDLDLKHICTHRVTSLIHCDSNEDILNLFMMTPYYFKTSLQDKEKINCLHQLDCTIDFYITIYKKQ
ncbi:putative RNA methyltransferase [Anaerorhabdus sp.]|uniref:putative RNA methyltransferase n=1 Tax=Anaerorhabdus sp. TaxID=1872524 RepID=UPI002FCCA60F